MANTQEMFCTCGGFIITGMVPREWYPKSGTPGVASHEGFETRGYTVLRRQVTQHRFTFSSINATSRSCHPNTADMYI
jgi:hypothetical protein